MISHPTANCETAWDLYRDWGKFKKGSWEYSFAADKYRRHIAKCPVCQGGLKNE